MDQEVSKSVWLGSSLTMLMASVALALVIYGIGRTVAMTYIDKMASVIADTDFKEMSEITKDTIPLTKSAVLGLYERNKSAIIRVTIVKPSGSKIILPEDGDLTALNIYNIISNAGERTTYNTMIQVTNIRGKATMIVYVE